MHFSFFRNLINFLCPVRISYKLRSIQKLKSIFCLHQANSFLISSYPLFLIIDLFTSIHFRNIIVAKIFKHKTIHGLNLSFHDFYLKLYLSILIFWNRQDIWFHGFISKSSDASSYRYGV